MSEQSVKIVCEWLGFEYKFIEDDHVVIVWHQGKSSTGSIYYSDWQFFGLAWEKAQKEKWWEEFLNANWYLMGTELINPSRFIEAVAEWIGGMDGRPLS